MKSNRKWVKLVGILLPVFGLLGILGPSPIADLTIGSSSEAKNLERAYFDWRRERLSEGPANLALRIGWSKGLSVHYTRASGRVTLELETDSVAVELGQLEEGAYDVWLVDNVAGPARSVRPEAGDEMLSVGQVITKTGSARMFKKLRRGTFRDFAVDAVIVTEAGRSPIESPLLIGIPTLFQRLHAQAWRGKVDSPLANVSRRFPRLLRGIGPVHAQSFEMPTEPASLIEEGRRLFFQETFNGNGRTCGTCHPADNNFTIDPRFIAGLPNSDPLFVAEFNPDLAENFENPTLMRRLGLILENTDGFDDLASKFTMRGVPHTLAMSTSLRPAPNGADGTTTPPDQRTGWSGDGSPGSGTLREFAIGAVTQHFPRTLSRVAGTDFRLPTDAELDAMEAFQLSIGRQEDEDLSTLKLRGAVPRRGLEIFLTADTAGGTVAAGKCNICHANAGATVFGGFNFNFDTGVEALPDQPGDLIDPERNPPDGGFGRDPHPTIPGAFGDGTFNTTPLVEAADTGPFFHNNSIQSLEEAVNFYNSAAFNESPAGQVLSANDSGAVGIRLEATQVEAVGSFLRVLNALENMRFAGELAEGARGFFPADGSDEKLVQGVAELTDAVEVLSEAQLHPDAVDLLQDASAKLQVALEAAFFRNPFINAAQSLIRQARAVMVEVSETTS